MILCNWRRRRAAEMFLKDTAGKMTREQIAQAEELAREWNPTTQLPR
jgi:hypothetical protein